MYKVRQLNAKKSNSTVKSIWAISSKAGVGLLITLCLCCASFPNDLDLSQRVLLLSTLRASTLEKELKQTAGVGYQILFASNEGSGGSGSGGLPQAFTEHNQLILEKVASAENLDYLYIKSRGESENSIAFLESDMNQAAAKGYRFQPRTFLGLMERRGSTDSSPALKYRIIQGSSKHLQEETCKASKEGFRFVDLVSSVVVMEKSAATAGDPAASPNAGPAQSAACPYLVIGVRTEGAMRKEIAAGAAQGYSIVAASCPGEILVMMEIGVPYATSKEYLILDSMRIGKLERDITEAAGRGFRAIPRAFITYSVTNVAIMVKEPSATNSFEYMILETQKASTLQKKMTEAVAQGFRPTGMNGSRTLLLERARPVSH